MQLDPMVRRAVFVALLAVPVLASAADIHVPSRVAPTLAAALGQATPGSTIWLDVGTFSGPVRVTEDVSIRGRGPDTVLTGDGSSQPVLRWEGARGAVAGLRIVPDREGIGIEASGEQALLEVSDVEVSGGAGGIEASDGIELVIDHGVILGTFDAGILLVDCYAAFEDVTSSGNGGPGLLSYSSWVAVDGGTFGDNGGAGVHAVGGILDARDVLATGNVHAGIYLMAVDYYDVHDSVLAQSEALTAGNWGDGLVAAGSEGEVRHSTLMWNARAGLSAMGGKSTISDTVFIAQTHDLTAEAWNGEEASLIDGGGNLCLDELLQPHACQIKTLGVQAPPPL